MFHKYCFWVYGPLIYRYVYVTEFLTHPTPHPESSDLHLAIKLISTCRPTPIRASPRNFFYRLTVRYISAYRFHLLLHISYHHNSSGSQNIKSLDSGLLASLLSCHCMLSLSLAGPGQETMYCWNRIGIGIRLGRYGNPDVLCTLCLFSSGIGLKEAAVSPWNERRGNQGREDNRRTGSAVPAPWLCWGLLREEEGRNVPMCVAGIPREDFPV
jgi:hypothetical protein